MPLVESENDTHTPVKAAEIRRLRDSIGWTQKDLERAADVSMSTVQRAERGDATLKARTIRPIAEALGVPLSAIYEIQDPPSATMLDEPAWFSDADAHAREQFAAIRRENAELREQLGEILDHLRAVDDA